MQTKKFPILYQASSKGKIKEWRIWIEDGIIRELHGYKDGKLIPETIEVTQKNIGKKNETSLFEQACSEAKSKWTKKVKKGYSEDGVSVNNSIIYPMLAQNFKTSKHRLTYPLMTQPKLNGIRCIHSDKYQSRYGNYWNTLSHLDKDIKDLQNIIGFPLDGELYIHGLDLQDIGALVKKERIKPEEAISEYLTKDIEYWIYDYVDTKTSFEDRNRKLFNGFAELGAKIITMNHNTMFLKYHNLICVGTFIVPEENKLLEYKKAFISAGFEGAMARNNVPYILCPGDHHSHELQKLKDILDDEFIIIGGKEGVGRDKGCCTFRCKTNEGFEFDVRPKGSVDKRKEYFNNLPNLIGKFLTCQFQEWTKEGIPFHARGIAIRKDYE